MFVTKYDFILNAEEYLELILFQSENSKSLKIVRIWLRLTIPLLVLILVMFFKIYNDYDLLFILALLVSIWILVFPKVWKAVIKNKTSRNKTNFLEKVKFENTHIEIEPDCISVKSESYDKIYEIRKLKHFVILSKVLLIFTEKEVVCIPRRLFDHSDPLELVTFLTKKAG